MQTQHHEQTKVTPIQCLTRIIPRTRANAARSERYRFHWRQRLCGLALLAGLAAPAAAAPDLHALAQAADASALRAALRAGADPQSRNRAGEPVLATAVQAQRTEAVRALLVAGADPDTGIRLGESPLHLAATGEPEILGQLLTAGADPNARDAGGVTPLMVAAGAGRKENIALLLEAGARLDMKDYQGASVRDWAARSGRSELAQDLETRIAALAPAAAKPETALDFAEDVFVDVKFPPWFNTSFLDLRDDLDEALAAGKQGIMLFVSSSRCSYCKAFMNTSLDDPSLQQRLRSGFDVIGLELFDDREMTDFEGRAFPVKDFILHHKAAYTPTLMFFGADGRMLLRIVGYYAPERFGRVLDYLQTQAYRTQHLRDYMRATKPAADRESRPMPSDDLFTSPPHMLDRSRMPAEQPLLVVFEGPDCAACDRFHQRVLQDKSVRKLIGRYEAVQLNAGDEQGRLITPAGARTSPAAWYRDLDLSYLPAILFFDPQGKEVMRIDSETLRFRMEGSLQLVLDRGHEDEPQLQRWRRARAIESIQRRSSEES